jgi:PAS domain S-box-containing protein
MKPALRIVIIEDSPDDALLVVREVEHAGYAVQAQRVQTAEELRATLAQGTWDLVLADYSLPHFSATEGLAILKETGLDVPFIIVSGCIGEEAAVQLMKDGTADYVMKDHLSRLGPTVHLELREADERRRKHAAERSLTESEEHYRVLVESETDLIVKTDPEGRFGYANPAYCALFGKSLQELANSSYEPAIHPDDLPSVADATAGLFHPPYSCHYEARAMTVDGWRWIEWNARAELDSQGTVVALLGSGHDITDRKRAEAEREAMQAQLLQSQKMEAIGQLAGGVAHDFNNLLTGIMGNIAIMRSSLPPADPLLENLNAAETAARQAADLAKGLLTFSRKAVVSAVSLDMAEAVDTTLAILKQSLPATMDIVCDVEQPAWSVMADRSQIIQVILNLAVNARDAMNGKGTLTIRLRNEQVSEDYVRAHPLTRTGDFVHLSVADTGPGIPDEIRSHLFEPFHTTKPTGSGTGMGLSIVYGAIKQADGWVTADSPSGAGTVFDIFLPRCLKEPMQSFTPSPLSVSVGSGTVLVVEDEPIVCAVAQALLSRSGYTVLTAPDGASALNVLRDHLAGIGLILLDMTMPGMTTDEVVQAIRALDPKVPILLNSGYTSNNTVKRMLAEGTVQGFLPKPYELHELLDTVDQLMKRT